MAEATANPRGQNHDKITSRLRTYTGSVMELLESVETRVKPYQHHLWNARFIRRQFHLDCDYFDCDTEALFLADFSTAMILGSGYKATCETDATANLYVVLVLYKVRVDGGGIETKCDYVRFWSSACTSAEFHHKAMHVVVKHLRDSGKVANLKRIRVWTDGHASTYKGRHLCIVWCGMLSELWSAPDFGTVAGFPNFGRMGYWPFAPAAAAGGAVPGGYEDAEGIEVFHCFFVPYKASGGRHLARFNLSLSHMPL